MTKDQLKKELSDVVDNTVTNTGDLTAEEIRDVGTAVDEAASGIADNVEEEELDDLDTEKDA